MIYFEAHEGKYCMALHISSCQSTVQTTKRRICAETTTVCLFKGMVQMSLRLENVCFFFFTQMKVVPFREGLTKATP